VRLVVYSLAVVFCLLFYVLFVAGILTVVGWFT
jgi:hypothetical protein